MGATSGEAVTKTIIIENNNDDDDYYCYFRYACTDRQTGRQIDKRGKW